jgi:beta-glucosidase
MIRNKIHALLALVFAQSFACAQPAAAIDPAVSITPAERFSEAWWKTRWDAKVIETKEAKRPELVFLGDSITQGWEGGGKAVWTEHYEKYRPLNLGFSGDRTEHLLWRLKNDEDSLKKLHPKVAVIMIGTNNTGHQQRPAADTTAGVKAILDEVQAVWPTTKILVLAIFPRGADANDKLRKLNDEINTQVAKFADNKTIYFQDVSPAFLAPDGTLPREIMPDLLHPNTKGYELWAAALDPKLKELGL